MTDPGPRRRWRRAGRGFAAGLLLAAASACAPKLATLPTGPGTPFPDAASAYADATAQCRGVKTLSAELALSGQSRGNRVRGRIVGGFAEPGQVRLEAPAPFGRPVFTMVMRGESATLLLNRERRVLRDVPPAALLEALAGVALGPDDLRAALAGCGLDVGQVTAGRSLPQDWLIVGDSTSQSWLRRVSGAWRLVASSRGPIELRYDQFASGRPGSVRLRTSAVGDSASGTDLTLRLSQVDINVPLAPAVFEIDIPADSMPLSLEELRRGGPLGGGDESAALPGSALRMVAVSR